MRLARLIAVCSGVWFATACAGWADDEALLARLHRLDMGTALDAAGTAPWHMKMSVQMYDAKGAPGEQGLIEAWWSGPEVWRVAYALPSYTAVELRDHAGWFRTTGADLPPWTLAMLLAQVEHPLPPERDIAGTRPELRKEKFGKAQLECVMLDRVVKAQVYFPVGTFPTYCTDAGKDSLRASYDYGSQLTLRNEVAEFAGRAVARDIAINRDGVAVASAQVFKLEAKAADAALREPAGDMNAVGAPPVRVGAATMTGMLVEKVRPVYPEQAKGVHSKGTVILQVVIGRDGAVKTLRLVAAPDADLDEAAIAAVKQWVYKPYLVDGVAVEVETTVLVNFSTALLW